MGVVRFYRRIHISPGLTNASRPRPVAELRRPLRPCGCRPTRCPQRRVLRVSRAIGGRWGGSAQTLSGWFLGAVVLGLALGVVAAIVVSALLQAR
jgi:hypothetical protein